MKDKTKSVKSLGHSESRAIAGGLAHVLADTFQLYLKTHGFHWNVEGSHFSELHALFEQQYQDLWAAMDVLAERMRALGHYVPASSRDFERLSTITSEDSILRAEAMVRQLADSHAVVIACIRKAYAAAEAGGDKATTALYDERLGVHQKHEWMLRSHLTKNASGDVVEKNPLKKLFGKK